jgi:glycosyltransferase involved in cell wall biosynthesis
VVLFVHNRYRTTGGEERVVEDLRWLVRERMGEPAELLERDSAQLGARQAALGLLCGGLSPGDVARAVRLTGARVVHAHNLQPALGWRALAAARAAGARVILHLHQYRLVCAVGTCFTDGAQCTRCHGRNTLPGVLHNCRASRPEALAYAASLALWQRRLVGQADAVVVPSAFARERLRELGAPLDWGRVHVLAPPLRTLDPAPPLRTLDLPAFQPLAGSHTSGGALGPTGSYALVVSRLSPEKGVDVAIEACRRAGLALVVAGDGPERAALVARAAGADVRFVGRVGDEELARLRADAAIALAPSRSAETFGLAAAEAMAAGLPVAASRVGALAELVEPAGLVPAGDVDALARTAASLAGDRDAGQRARERVRGICAPEVVARALAAIYDGRARADGVYGGGPAQPRGTGRAARPFGGRARPPST